LEAGTTIARIVKAGVPNPENPGSLQVNLGLVNTEAGATNRAAEDQASELALKVADKAREDRIKKTASLKAAVNPKLPEEHQQRTFDLLMEFDDCFAENKDDLGTCHMVDTL
jgi:hypothetical protein